MSAVSGTIEPVVRASRTTGSSRAEHLVGRSDQRSRLRTLLDEVISDGSRFVIIGGDAGVGKTTIIEAFAADLFGPLADRKAQLIRGQCVPLGGEGLPYAPIVGTLRDLVAQHGREQVLAWAGAGGPALGVLLPDLTGGPPESDSIRLQLFEAVTQLWERASEHSPLVVILEDIHWADESTRHLLRFLARALTDASVMIVASYRTDELTRRHPLRPFLAEIGRLAGAVRVDVPSLNRAEVAELLTRLLDRPPSNAVIDTVFRRSEGIPYFVEELTRSAARGCIDMPDTLRDALNVRVQNLSEEAHQVVELAAVAGNHVDHELLASVAGGSAVDLDRGLREAIDASVLTADETGYGFRHALLREVVHDDLLPGQHARLHARFAAHLESQPQLVSPGTAPLEIAHHWSAAHEVTKAFTWSITAARSDLAAYHEALKMYERALELWDQVADPESVAGPRASVLKQAANAASNAGEDERALALVNAALAEFGPDSDTEERITALMLKASLLGGLLRPGTVEPLREAMTLLPDDADPVLRARVIESLARQLMLSGQVAEGVSTAREAVAAAVGLGSNKAESHARNTLATSLQAIGEEAEAMAEWERAGPLARGHTMTELRYFINFSDALHLTGRYADAVSQAMTGIELARERGLERSVGSMLAGNAAEPLISLGQWSRAYAMTERALELDPPANHVAHLRLLQAWLRIWRGELDEAEVILREFRSMISSQDPSPQYVSQVIRTDAEYAMAVGEQERAWADVSAFLDRWETYHAAWTYPVLAVGAAAARALDQADGTEERSGLIRNVADRRALKINIRPLWLPVITAELADSAEGWRTALAELHALPGPAHLRPYAGLRLAQHLVAGRERAEAKAVLATASEQAAALGARLLTDRLAALAHRAGLGPATDGPVSPLAGLTPREIEVLQLVAAGNSNGEIGSALFISTKTASVHVSNILAKLGVSGRGEAAALAYRLGLVSV
jgi:predicted ATPase/DNA-binding CsgD family transcriptional regulator